MGPIRPVEHRQSDIQGQTLPAHRLWLHYNRFDRETLEHLLPGERTLHEVGYRVAARIIRFWMGRLVDPEELNGIMRIQPRHLWGDFRPERKAHLTEQTSVSYKTGFDDGIRYVYAQLERKLVDQEFPIR